MAETCLYVWDDTHRKPGTALVMQQAFNHHCYFLCHPFISRKCLETRLRGMYFYHHYSIGMYTSHFFLNTLPAQTINSPGAWLIRTEKPALPIADFPVFRCWSIQRCFIERCSVVDHFLLLQHREKLVRQDIRALHHTTAKPWGTQWCWSLAATVSVHGSFAFM